MQIAIVLYPGFTALDFIGPYEILRNLPDAEVRFVWHQPGPIAADSGVLLVGATHSFDETPSPDVVLVPGGMSTFEHARDEKVLEWVRRAHETSTWTTSVCSGSAILAAAGVLKGMRATSHWMVVPMLKPFGVTPVGNERIVADGKLVTCAGVSAGLDMALWLVQIGGESKARRYSSSSSMTRSRRSTRATSPRRPRRPRRWPPRYREGDGPYRTTHRAGEADVGPGHQRRPQPRQEGPPTCDFGALTRAERRIARRSRSGSPVGSGA